VHLKRTHRERLTRRGGYYAAVDRTGRWGWPYARRGPARIDARLRRLLGKTHWSVKRFDPPSAG